MSNKKVWLITGCSSGLGRAIALAALEAGDIVAATARNPTGLGDLKARGAVVEQLDVTANDASLTETVESVLSKTNGRIDILVNNEGYMLNGGVEECSHEEVQAIFSANVFGQLNVIRAVLPIMRKQHSGIVANIGSIEGWHGTPANGLYSATKACAAMLSESLRAEVAHLGIKVTCIEPGYFRTDAEHRLRAQKVIEDLREGVGPAIDALDAYSYRQPGDPGKAGKLIMEALSGRGSCRVLDLPPRLVIGNDAYEIANGLLNSHKENLEHWKDLIIATDYED
ncbi:serine 3-dehydrogenase [Hypoxylon sp. NC0597]|nr:serine 3-dehydrogenase [Hypoxylon sp. NC0597]